MAQPNFYRRYNFSIEPGQIFERDVFAAYIAFFSFSDEDGAANVDIRFNGGEFNRVTPSTRFDFTETLVTPTASDASGTFVNKIGLRNNGDKTVTGAFATSMGRITDSILAFGDDTAGSGIPTRLTAPAEVKVVKGQSFPVVDIAALDDSGIILNSEHEAYASVIRNNNNPTFLNPRGYELSTTNSFNYAGLTVGELYAYDLERLEMLPQWIGTTAAGAVGQDYRLDAAIDCRIFAYNGAGQTQKRGYRRGGLTLSWIGEKEGNSYGNLGRSLNAWYDFSGGLNAQDYGGAATFFEQKIEKRPFIFRATATTLTLQAFLTGEIRWSHLDGQTPPAGATMVCGVRIRSSVQPINPDALETDDD